MDKYPGYFEAERGLFEMYESMDQPIDYLNGTNCNEELESQIYKSFIESEISEIYSETPHITKNIYDQHSFEVFGSVNGYAGSILPRRSLHKKTVRSVRRIVTNSSSREFSGCAQIWNSSIRNHPSAPPARYQLKQHHSRRMLHKYYPHQSYQSVCSNLPAHATEHPASPPARYQLKQHHSRRILHKYCPHQSHQNVGSNLPAQATEQLHCTVDSVRKSKYSCEQQSRTVNSEMNTSNKGVSLRNFPNAPAPYITQLKHNEQTSRFISQLSKKVTTLSKEKKCSSNFEECGEISFIQGFQSIGNSSQDLIEISSEDSYEEVPLNVKNKNNDTSSLNSDSSESEQFFMSPFPNSGKEYGSFTKRCTSFKDRKFIPDLASLTSDVTFNESHTVLESTISSCSSSPLIDHPELPRCHARPEMNVISPLKLAEDTCVEPESSCFSLTDESHKGLESTISFHNTSQNDHPELPRCLSTPEIQDMDFISPLKITDDTHDEMEGSPSPNEKSTEGIKLEVSFSFMEKGGYHPIALPLGCHILEDGSDDSELDEEGTSVLEKRMNKMGRDEYNLNVDTSSSYMPWIVIPLDDVPRANYEGVKFQNPDDPRCRKKEKLLEFDSMGHDASLLSPLHETEISSAACSPEYQNDSKIDQLIDKDKVHKDIPTSVDFLTVENTNVCSNKTSEILKSAKANPEEELNIFDLSFPDLFLQRNADALEFPDIFLDSLSQERVNSKPRKETPQSVSSSMDTYAQVFPCEQGNGCHMNMNNSLKFSDKILNSVSQKKVISESKKELPQSLNSNTLISSQEFIPCPQQSKMSLNYDESSLEFHDTIMNSLVQEKGISEPGKQFLQTNKSETEVTPEHDQRNTFSMNVDENLLLEMAIPNVCESENKTSNHKGISATLQKSALTDKASVNQNVFSKKEQQKPCNTEDTTVKSEESSSPAIAKKLPNSTVQLLKESFAFLKDDSFSTRRVRRLRRVSTSLRVQDYALPNSLEEFYVESESCNFAERTGISLSEKSHGNEMPLPCSTKDETYGKKTRPKDNTENDRMVMRSSNRAANRNRSNQVSIIVSKPSRQNYQKSTKKVEKRNLKKEAYKDTTQQSFQEEQTTECKRQNNQQENSKLERKSPDAQNRLLVVQFEGRKYNCNEGILTPVSYKDSVSIEKESGGSDLSFNNDFDQNASKTGHKARMRSGVVKKRKRDEKRNSPREQSTVKKSRSSQSPKVMVQNCLQEIAVSITKNSQTVTTRKSKKVCIVQKTTKVKKELFPVNKEKSGKTIRGIAQSTALKLQEKGTEASHAKNGVSEEKKHSVVKQNQSSSKSDQKKTEKNEKTVSTDGKVSKPKKEESPHKKEDKAANKKHQRKLPVKPIIKIHQGLRNTSLKTFKAQQSGKNEKELAKNIPQKPFPCPICEKGFKKASQIEKHIKDDHKCSRCDKELDSKEAKQRHFYSFHATEVHKCVTCQKEYNYPFHLRKHFESQAHKDLIKCLVKEMKKFYRGASSIRGTSLKDGYPKPAICPSKTSNHDLALYDKFSQSRSRKKNKFMEMESNFFDKNADLLELIHKIDYTSGENGIVRHFHYKDPELAEIQSCLKEESHSSTCYEEIKIVKEYSITSHCENFLEDAGYPLAISDSTRSSERRDSETSNSGESSELDQGWNNSNIANNVTMEPLMYSKARLESNSNSAMSGWFSAAFDVIEERNLDDDPTYSSYLGLLNNEAGMNLCSISGTFEPFNKSTQEYSSGAAKTYRELSSISSAEDLGYTEKGPTDISSQEMESINYPRNDQIRAQNFSLSSPSSYTWNMQDRTCLLPTVAKTAESISQKELSSNGKDSCPLLIPTSVYGGHQTMSWIPSNPIENDTLHAAQSLILLSNPEQGISPELDNHSNSNDSTNKDVWMEWETICSEIQRDYTE